MRIGGIVESEVDHPGESNGRLRRSVSGPHGRETALIGGFFGRNQCFCNMSKTAAPTSQGKAGHAV
jgi:hypothetical protein